MRKVGRKDTGPEITLRHRLHAEGFRYKLNDKTLPGSPDIVLPKYKTVIFVHGCFWHRHQECHLASTPKDNADFWRSKFEANVARDAYNEQKLMALGWHVVTVWQCELKKRVLDNTISEVITQLKQK